MQIFDFISRNNSAIEAIVAILNLVLIGFLTFRGYLLQNKAQTMELYFRIQQESFLCMNVFSDLVIFFENIETSCSYYLRDLHTRGSNDPFHEENVKVNLSNIMIISREILILKNNFQSFNDRLVLEKIPNHILQDQIIKVVHLKSLLLNNSPKNSYESNTNGAKSIWLDDEVNIDNAFKATINSLKSIESIISNII
ncbi:hypothetical protein LVY74_01520 [Acinetobacter sp. ME22]|uniref:hypothetical protein n=1 Tax=Acinetobacter sp. ME22 TaxID=2904802 RepID=UPI001EDAECFB|nr:hypothetical protein [Acinetobacter sp. ME22]MCG2572235.1 hypothetical protein [Acinetobacter sp. ME22]